MFIYLTVVYKPTH